MNNTGHELRTAGHSATWRLCRNTKKRAVILNLVQNLVVMGILNQVQVGIDSTRDDRKCYKLTSYQNMSF